MKPSSLKILINSLITISGMLSIYFHYAENFQEHAIFKGLTTVLIIAIPFLFKKGNFSRYDYLMVIGLVFCLGGDLLLLKPDDYFVFGLLSFLIAHLLFSYGFTRFGGLKTYWKPLVFVLVFTGAVFALVFEGLKNDNLVIPVAVYILVISFMSWQGISLYIWKNKKAFLSIAIAAVLFMISDSMIAISSFRTSFELSGLLILITYWASITLLAHSTHQIDE
jgi:uncharacterized membrane protein YhhN